PELQLALTWRDNAEPTAEWAGRYDPSFERAMNFLDASRRERDRDVSEKEERRRHQLRQARRLVAVFSVVSLIMVALGSFALTQRNNAVIHQKRAEEETLRAENQTKIAESARIKAISESARAERERKEADQQRANAEHQSTVAVQQSTRAESEAKRAEAERVKAEANAADARAKKAEAEVARADAVKEKGVAVSAQKNAETSQKETLRLSHLAAARALALSILQLKDPQTSGLLALEVDRLNRENGGVLDDPAVFDALR